jgi:RNA polymerase sigma-70 factor, ECF subfamily
MQGRVPPTPPRLDEVYREHFDYVYRVARRLGGSLVDAEDAAQEVFFIVGRKLHTFDGSSLITTWLYGITLNVVRALRRRAQVRRLFELSDDDEHDLAVEPRDPMDVIDAHRIAYTILDKMSAPKREAFILAEFEGLRCEEIAELVGAKTETIWSRLHYARKEFAERLAALGKKR